MKKPNIVFLTIDSLRSDKIYGKLKKSQIPNLEKIINKGLFFPNTITSTDATDPGLGCIFTGTYPFNNGITFYKNHKKANFFFNILKNNGYHLYSMLPNKAFFNTLSDSFDNSEKYEIDPYVLLYQGTGEKIIKTLKSKSLAEPWIYYIHIMDLHPTGGKFVFPERYQSQDYGSNDYEKTISALDWWIGKFFENMDTSSTVFILTADHGDFIPESGKGIDDISSIQKKLRPLKKFLPLGEKFWGSILAATRSTVKKIRISKIKQNLNEFQLRTYYNRAEGHLFDEIIKVPLILLMLGHKPAIFNEQISTLDILPTLFELLQINFLNDLDGQSLLPLVNNLEWNEKSLYIESTSTSHEQKGKTIGVRTPEYKYYRSKDNPKKIIALFDLKNDPFEKNNLAKDLPQIVDSMEKILIKLQKSDNYKENLKNIIKKKYSSLKLE